jgi:hypothetical protein
VAQSSSAQKVAKLAQQGKGKKVRFQGGTLFPLLLVGAVVLGLLLIVYARQSRPADGSGSPTIEDHWHAAFGMYVCDTYLPNLLGNKEETSIVNGQENFTNEAFRNTGIHSHDDGAIHWHPNSSRSTGNRATLGVFLDVYGVEVTDTSLTLPPDQVSAGEQREWNTTDDTCTDADGNEQETEMKLVVWPSYSNPDDFTVYTTNFGDARIQNDGMVFSIAFVEKGKDVPVPPWAAELPELGAADGGAPLAPVGSSTVPGTDPATTDPATTDAPTTTGG